MWRKIICFLFAALIASAVSSTETNIISQDGSPIIIETFEIKRVQGIRAAAQIKNASSETIIAVRLGLVRFTYFNEFINKWVLSSSSELAPGETNTLRMQSASPSPEFLSVFVWVEKVRFSDGEIWSANKDQVLATLRRLQPSFQAEWLIGDVAWKE